MKTIILLLLLVVSATTYAQETAPPAKGDNAILVRTSLTDEDAYEMIRVRLQELGYPFQENKAALTITTGNVPVDNKPSYQVATVITVSQGTITLSGKLTTLFEGTPATFPIQYTKANSSMYRYGFRALEDLGKSLENSLAGGLMAYSKY
ncbi:hypothetical protein GCM10023187_47080 [Nibrella viscosa]|uniref:DUF4468 domain-containing protein n=1 Tax=Nibrella viscosa TaxID=1084524 RepID=A0ABP8KU95_9BACT